MSGKPGPGPGLRLCECRVPGASEMCQTWDLGDTGPVAGRVRTRAEHMTRDTDQWEQQREIIIIREADNIQTK